MMKGFGKSTIASSITAKPCLGCALRASHLLEVCPGGKRPACARQHQHTHAVVRRRAEKDLGQLVDQQGVEGVQRLPTIHVHHANPVLVPDPERLHGRLLLVSIAASFVPRRVGMIGPTPRVDLASTPPVP
jgi:hypothetical protein